MTVSLPPAGLPLPGASRVKHRWRFFQAGGLRQVRLHRGEDIAALAELPQELWTILVCPVQGVRFDARTLALLDANQDGRIRLPELLAGVKWACDRLRDPASLLDDSPRLPLAAFAASGEGHALQELARRILADIGQPGADAISLDDLGKRQALLAKTPFNGDGIITPEAAADAPEVKQLIGEILAACGGTDDLCGALGIGREQLDRFYNEARAHIAWIEQGGQPGVQPLGAATAAASAAIQAVRAKIDDYFTRCRLTAYDPCAAAPLNQGEAVYGTIAPLDLQTGSEEIASLPLAQADAGRPLPLRAGVNPAWAAALAHFAEAALEPLLGVTTGELTEAHWRQVLEKIAPYEAWMAAKAGAAVEGLGAARLQEILAGDGHARIAALLERDLSFASGAAQIADLEKLILYHNHLNRLLNNFVNFNDFYDPEQTAIFRAGRLYMDGRYFDLCVNVRDVASHATLAASSKIFLVYCDITRPDTKEKQSICVAVTAGFAGSLWVGRNGLFYDRDGRDWDAVIVKIAESPVSLKEAFWSPWIKISAMIGDQIRKLLTSRQDAMLSATAKQLDATTATVQTGEIPVLKPPPRMEGAALASSVAAIGIAVGLIGSAVGGLVSAVSGLSPWRALLGVVAIFFAVSGPSVVLAWFKLRGRDLAPVLNACGWAVNSRIRITFRLGHAFTRAAYPPAGSEIELGDAYPESRRGRNWLLIILGLLIVLYIYWRLDWLNRWLPASWEHQARPAAASASTTNNPTGGDHGTN